VEEPPDDRSQLALAMEWASRVTAVSLEMVVPIVVGHWLDGQWTTEPVLTVVGAAFGLIAGMWHLLRMTRPPSPAGNGQDTSDRPAEHSSDGTTKK